MTRDINPRGDVAQLLPPEMRDALRVAAAERNTALIDEITLRAHKRGFVRHPSDGSRFQSRAPGWNKEIGGWAP